MGSRLPRQWATKPHQRISKRNISLRTMPGCAGKILTYNEAGWLDTFAHLFFIIFVIASHWETSERICRESGFLPPHPSKNLSLIKTQLKKIHDLDYLNFASAVVGKAYH